METVRAFIALDIGDEIRSKLDELQHKLKKVHSNVRWTKPKSMHLTLVFLGDVPAEKVGGLTPVLDQACFGQGAFAVQAIGTGTFGRPSHPRVIWAGISDCPALAKLQHRIAEGLSAAGFEFDDKPFSPHLTLGRIKGIDQHTEPLLQKIEKYGAVALGETRIDHVELIQSERTPGGSEYTVLHKVELA